MRIRLAPLCVCEASQCHLPAAFARLHTALYPPPLAAPLSADVIVTPNVVVAVVFVAAFVASCCFRLVWRLNERATPAKDSLRLKTKELLAELQLCVCLPHCVCVS